MVGHGLLHTHGHGDGYNPQNIYIEKDTMEKEKQKDMKDLIFYKYNYIRVFCLYNECILVCFCVTISLCPFNFIIFVTLQSVRLNKLAAKDIMMVFDFDFPLG